MSILRDVLLEAPKGASGTLVGQSALWRLGFTHGIIYDIQLTTLYPDINRCQVGNVIYYFSPISDRDEFIDYSVGCIRVPTRERALFEAMMLRDTVTEDILLESLIDFGLNNVNKLYAVCDVFCPSFKANVDYWVNEALDYEDDP
ncbi:MAG: hypothetical protein NC548_11170 [Lachnospiraceae bacterium]|nr:hypothetical protein [Lachnospiraceae bacterium]